MSDDNISSDSNQSTDNNTFLKVLIELRYAIKIDLLLHKNEIKRLSKREKEENDNYEYLRTEKMGRIRQCLLYLDEIDGRMERVFGIEHGRDANEYCTSSVCDLRNLK
jgi:hypothetical protein